MTEDPDTDRLIVVALFLAAVLFYFVTHST
jgi:hypothetical protein